jgi:hypothetical protein
LRSLTAAEFESEEAGAVGGALKPAVPAEEEEDEEENGADVSSGKEEESDDWEG